MDHPEGASETGGARLSFDRRVWLEFHGSKISSNGGLLLFRELDEVLGLRDSRRTALYELKKEAQAVGANAVVGIDLDYVELSGAGSMVMLVASGTAVVIEDLEE